MGSAVQGSTAQYNWQRITVQHIAAATCSVLCSLLTAASLLALPLSGLAALPTPLVCLQGAVLEPQGVVEIKFRAPELIATMHRIDPLILKLKVGGRYYRLYRCTAVLQVCWSAGSVAVAQIAPLCWSAAASRAEKIRAAIPALAPRLTGVGFPLCWCRLRAVRALMRPSRRASGSYCRCTTKWPSSLHRWVEHSTVLSCPELGRRRC